ncbi:MAG: hypothetical protein JNK05_30155 [Myxococcales bacterium]|nr:hypothetical protein [Myxococcales bacterium]
MSYAIGENFAYSCGFCTCGSNGDGGASGACFSVACTSGTDVDTRPFERIGTTMCDPEFRRIAYSGTAAEVRHPCGISGGPIVRNDPRCPTLCAGVIPRSARNAGCNRTEDPNMVLCWGM